MKIPLIGLLPQSFRAYRELFRQGAIMSSARDEDVEVTLKGYITGDVQISIVQRKGELNPDALSVTNLQGVGGEAVARFRSKFISLQALPLLLIFMINSGGLYLYYNLFYQQLKSDLPAGIPELLNPENLPYLILPALSFFFRRHIGSFIIKSIVWVLSRIKGLYNRLTAKEQSRS